MFPLRHSICALVVCDLSDLGYLFKQSHSSNDLNDVSDVNDAAQIVACAFCSTFGGSTICGARAVRAQCVF